jgi:RNA polymerase sigma-70 factor (ECF subfamily)
MDGPVDEKRPIVYCLVPRDVAPKLHEPLRRHFALDPTIEVVLERRSTDRRSEGERRADEPDPPCAPDRRRIRNRHGRRVGERRAATVVVAQPRLPRRARAYADRIWFVERIEPSEQHSEDLDTARLITCLQAGEKEVFGDLYLRYFDRVYGYLRVALNDSHEAEDLAQQVFIKAMEGLSAYERRSQPFRSWLFTIARNSLLDHLRTRRRVEPEDPDELDRRRGTSTEEASLRALQWLSDSDVLCFVERLPLAQRQVLVLRYMMDFSTAEIAEVLGRSPDSVRQAQHRALAYLAERLSALGREPMSKKSRHGMYRVPLRRRQGLLAHGFGLAR